MSMGRWRLLGLILAMYAVLTGCVQRKREPEPVPTETAAAFHSGQTPGQSIRLDLSGMTLAQAEEAVRGISGQEKVRWVDCRGSELRPDDVLRLRRQFPEARFHYDFTLFGQPVNTCDEEIEIAEADPGENYEAELRQALELMNGCRILRLDNCPVDNDSMAAIREEYRGRTKVVWRIFFAERGSCMTDRKVIRYVYNMDDSNCSALQYCEDAEYLDFGHNETLSDCSWAAKMPKLKAVILSGSLVSDLSAFSGCRELEFLELAYCSRVRDLSPLKECRKLQMINTSYTGVEDFSPLDEAPLERLCSVHCKATDREQRRLCSIHPACLMLFQGRQPYGYCWRYEKDGYTPTEYYSKLKEVFHYPDTHDTTW